MRRRLLGLCLLAYPPLRRKGDRDYLRDLALDLSDTYGVRRQALSLLRGGLTERVRLWRTRRRTSRSAWTRRAVAASIVLAAAAFAAISLSGGATTAGLRVEADRFVCVEVDHSLAGAEACAEVESQVATRRRDGWDCVPQRHAREGWSRVAWRCAL